MTTRPSNIRRTIDARLGLRRPRASRQVGDWVVAVPSAVGILLAVMAMIHFIRVVTPKQLTWKLDYTLGFVPGRFASGLEGRYGVSMLEGAGPLISHVFVHGNFAHITMNALGLAIFGTAVARRLRVEASGGAGAWNTTLFLGFFFASGVAGALAYGVVNAGSGVLLVGASGAISGTMAAAMRFALRPFAPYGPASGPLASPAAMPIMVVSLVYVGSNLLTPLGLGQVVGIGLDIAWEAHVGGYLFGLFAFPLFDRAARRGRSSA